jgi:hypothetical protein
MLMEIYLSEEKAKKNNIDLNECYQKIDKYFKSRGVEIVSKGIYKGVKEDFDTFVIAQMQLPDTKWFLKIVDQWYISYFGDTPDSPEYMSDALDSYYRITKQTNEYIRKQKHRI